LLRTLIENLIVQSSRDVGSLNVFLAKHGLNMGSLLSLLTQEINKVVTPPVVDLLLTTTQPQSLAISYNTGTLQGGLCKVNEQLPIIIFSASLLERVSKSILQNDKLRSLFTGVASFKATYTDPLDPTAVNSSRQITTTSTIFWVILVVLVIILLLVIFYLVRG